MPQREPRETREQHQLDNEDEDDIQPATDSTNDTSQQRSSTMTSLNLPQERSEGHIFLFCGGMGCGKTTSLIHCMYPYFKKAFFKFGVVFAPSKDTGDYDFLPDNWVHEQFSMDKLETYVAFLKAKRKQIKAKFGKEAELPPSFLVLDDTFGSVQWYHPAINQLLILHRHLNLWVFITCQSLAGHGSSTSLRNWANYIFLFRAKSGAEVESNFRAFGKYTGETQRIFADANHFVALLNHATSEQYRCMLIQAQIGKPISMSYWKAGRTKPFTVIPPRNIFGL